MPTLQTDFLSATFTEVGAELSSLKNNNGEEYIWEADPRFWNRHAPVLFPIVGRLQDDTYQLNGNTYHLSQHGFARDQRFEVISNEANQLVFSLTSNSETLKVYPFTFSFLIIYRLESNCLFVQFRVENLDAVKMPFSVGGHPAFRTPFHPNTQRNEYDIAFAKKHSLSITPITADGLLQARRLDFLENQQRIAITDDLFDKGALVFKNHDIEEVSLEYRQKPYVKMKLKGFPFFGIWSKASDAPFVCLEPWYGIADTEGFNDDLTKKEGINVLDPGEVFSCEYSIEVF